MENALFGVTEEFKLEGAYGDHLAQSFLEAELIWKLIKY